MKTDADLYQQFQELNINYHKHEHPPIFTVAEAEKYERNLRGGKTKNLFVRNKKGDQHYLIVIDADKRADLKAVQAFLQSSKLSFASPERLYSHLGVKPGSVTAFALINDPDHQIKVIIDEDLMQEDYINFHPLRNDSTLEVAMADFNQFLAHLGHQIQYTKL